MQLSRPDPETLLLSDLDALLIDLLRRISRSADPSDSDAARARLFSAPTHDAEDANLLDDWSHYVEPELAQLFQSTLQVIDADLRELKASKSGGRGTLAIPVAHLEQWVHGLNQARLALAARHDFGDEDMEHPLPKAGDDRAFALLQMRFYGLLQEIFLRELEGH